MSQLRLKQVALVTTELDTVLDDLAAVFGLRVAFRDPMVARFGLRNAVLPVGAQFLEVIEPVQAGTAAGRYLKRRGGPGGYMAITHTGDQAAYRQRLLPGLGVRVAFEFEADGFRCLQLHPSDTGGAFFEIDEQDGADRPGGPWPPAGPDWPSAVSTAVISAIEDVRIQCAEPARVAARWARIVQRDLGGGGREILELDAGRIEFTGLTDARGDGLSAVLVRAADQARALSAATARGLPVGAGEVTICGTRFVLQQDRRKASSEARA